MDNKDFEIDKILQTVYSICDDADTFRYNRRNGYRTRIKEKLGSGLVTSAIALFSVVSFLSKIYYLLTKENIFPENREEEFFKFKEKLKALGIYSKNNKFLKKPNRLEINEQYAFIHLIKNYPDDFGLKSLDNEDLGIFWNTFRNNLIHTCFIGNETMIVEVIQTYLTIPNLTQVPGYQNLRDPDFNENRFKKNHRESFYSIPNKEKLRGKILQSQSKDDITMSPRESIQMTLDRFYIDDFCIDVRNIANWIREQFNAGKFSDSCKEQLKLWFIEQGIIHSYKIQWS